MKTHRMVCLVMVFLTATVVHGQITTGTISGIATDGTGAVIPGATVLILNEETGISRTATTDAAGRYLVPSLSLGRYRVTVSQQGFQTEARTGIVLTVGRNAVVDVQLTVGTVSQTVEVTGEAPLVETEQSAVSYLVNESTISELPLNGRDITQLILLNPGVSLAENSATGNAYVGFGKKFAISGFRGEDNAYLLDGGYINNMNRQLPSGPSGALLGSETVKEFQVITNSFSAQYGRALGGVFNAVSKSGTNEWHGNLYEYHRNSALDARRWEDRKVEESDPRIPPFRRNSFGGTLGGPIRRDKAFFFGAYEAMRESKTTTEYRDVPTLAARNGNPNGNIPGWPVAFTVSPTAANFLKLFPNPSPGGRDFGDGTAQFIYPGDNPAQEDYGQGRIDYQLSDNVSFFGRLTASNAEKSFPDSYPGYATTQVMNSRLATLSQTHVLSPAVLNTVRFAFNRVDPQDIGKYPQVDASLLSVPGAVSPPTITPGSVTANSGAPKPFDRWVTNRYNIQDDMNWTLGGHALQFGGMLERMQFNLINPNRPYGTWSWNELYDFLRFGQAGVPGPNNYRGTPDQLGDPARGFRQWFFGLYLQDDWQVTPRLTLNVGLRWEPYSVPTEVDGKIANLRNLLDPTETRGGPYWKNRSWTDFGPRFGFAWSPFASGSTSVRGGVGLFYVPNDGNMYRTQSTRNQFNPEYNFNGPCCFPNALAAIAAAPVSESPEAIPYENQKSGSAIQWSFSVQRQLGRSTVVTLGYARTRGLNRTFFATSYNTPVAIYNGRSLEVPVGATVLNPNFNRIRYYANGADSWYNGLTVSLQRRFAGGLQTQLAYTWSKALSNADASSTTDTSGGGGNPRYAHDLRASKGYSGYHLDHVLSVNYLYELPFGQGVSGVAGYLTSGWQLSGILSLKTGQPFNLSAGVPTALNNLGFARTPNLDTTKKRQDLVLGRPDESDKYFDVTAFAFPAAREIGNVTKSFMLGPGTVTWDFSLTKNTQVSESMRLQFRSEFFNLLNRANFSSPSGSLFGASGVRSGSAGVITTTTTTGRQIQLGLKLIF
jgi:outer membrane receptor protein involved in Fe transport